MARKKLVVRLELRLYRGQALDDVLIAWLDELDSKSHGIKSQAIKEALLRGIGQSPAGAPASVSIDAGTVQTAIEEAMNGALRQLRRVVEASVESALHGFGGDLTPQPVERSVDEQEEVEAVTAGMNAEFMLEIHDDD